VAKRLEQIDNENIVYHVSNSCYKSYTHCKVLKKIQEGAELESDDSADVEVAALQSERPTTRANSTPRAPASSDNVPVYEKKCTVCANVKFKGERKNIAFVKTIGQENFLKLLCSFKTKFIIELVIYKT